MTQPKTDSGTTTSPWMATTSVPTFPPLDADAECDVCIVGAGITGLSIAYTLARAGKRVIVLDDGPIGGGETGRTTAHSRGHSTTTTLRSRRFTARMARASRPRVIDRQSIESRRSFATSVSIASSSAWTATGLPPSQRTTSCWTPKRTRRVEPARCRERMATVPGCRSRRRARFGFRTRHSSIPLKYLSGLAGAIVRLGGRIHCGSHVADFEKKPRRPQVKTSDKHTVTADAVVVATNSPVNDWVTMHTKQAPYRTYVIAVRVPSKQSSRRASTGTR